jgi:hypothetical protein
MENADEDTIAQFCINTVLTYYFDGIAGDLLRAGL